MSTVLRSIESLGGFNPLIHGDQLEIAGKRWQVGQGSYGWCLHEPGKRLAVHPSIRDIPGMVDFISAIKLVECEAQLDSIDYVPFA